MLIILGNGPSNQQFLEVFDGWSDHIIGCNKSFLDFPVNELVVRDKPAFLHLDEVYRNQLPYTCYVPEKYLAASESYGFSKKWTGMSRPTPPSAGACAVLLAGKLYPHTDIYCIGFDSVISPQGNQNTTNYDYPFRNGKTIKESTSISHRKQVTQAVADIQNTNTVTFVSETPWRKLWSHEDFALNTITPEEFLELRRTKIDKRSEQCETVNDMLDEPSRTGGEESEVIQIHAEENS